MIRSTRDTVEHYDFRFRQIAGRISSRSPPFSALYDCMLTVRFFLAAHQSQSLSGWQGITRNISSLCSRPKVGPIGKPKSAVHRPIRPDNAADLRFRACGSVSRFSERLRRMRLRSLLGTSRVFALTMQVNQGAHGNHENFMRQPYCDPIPSLHFQTPDPPKPHCHGTHDAQQIPRRYSGS